jgi:hypothetical protein
MGFSTRSELADAEALMQRRMRCAVMGAGVTLMAPETVFLSADTRLSPDVIVEANVIFVSGCHGVEEGASMLLLLDPEIPLVALLRLVHLGIARLVGVLGRGRRIDDLK